MNGAMRILRESDAGRGILQQESNEGPRRVGARPLRVLRQFRWSRRRQLLAKSCARACRRRSRAVHVLRDADASRRELLAESDALACRWDVGIAETKGQTFGGVTRASAGLQ
jgi:hypothetical protein